MNSSFSSCQSCRSTNLVTFSRCMNCTLKFLFGCFFFVLGSGICVKISSPPLSGGRLRRCGGTYNAGCVCGISILSMHFVCGYKGISHKASNLLRNPRSTTLLSFTAASVLSMSTTLHLSLHNGLSAINDALFRLDRMCPCCAFLFKLS